MVSFNHYANGAVGDWLYKRMVGLEPTSGGYKTFRVAPQIGGGITWAQASTETTFGKTFARRKEKKGMVKVTVEVPVSTMCEVVMPNHEIHHVQSGKHTFTVTL